MGVRYVCRKMDHFLDVGGRRQLRPSFSLSVSLQRSGRRFREEVIIIDKIKSRLNHINYFERLERSSSSDVMVDRIEWIVGETPGRLDY